MDKTIFARINMIYATIAETIHNTNVILKIYMTFGISMA